MSRDANNTTSTLCPMIRSYSSNCEQRSAYWAAQREDYVSGHDSQKASLKSKKSLKMITGIAPATKNT